MMPSALRLPCTLLSPRLRFSMLLLILTGLLLPATSRLLAQEAETQTRTPSRLVSPIDEHARVTLKGNVRKDLTPDRDMGMVEDGMQLHLYLLLQRSPAQQADLDNFLARQQEPTAQEYHKWLTPKQFGARFGASPEDIAKLSTWLESHGFQVRGVLNNASMIDFAATAGQVREAFHTQLHYFNIRDGKHAANVQEPQIPAALAPVVAGIKGLSKIPGYTNHTKVRQSSYDAETHSWHPVETAGADLASPAYNSGGGFYLVTPQDFYTIYNVNPAFTGGELAANATVAVIEESDIEYGSVNGTTHVATGGDVATFRSLFGVPGTLNMHVYHGFGTVTCNDPGIDPNGNGEDGEASLDAEWINATAPSANEIFMSCDQSPDNGIFSSMAALIDNSLSDVMSLSYGETELDYTSSDYTFQDTLYAQAASQGQSIFISSGDSGSDSADQNTGGTATSGINVSAFAAPTVTVTGGTDFVDLYDALEGGAAQSTYWGAANSAQFGDALGYVPETAWNGSCASSIYAAFEGDTGASLCASQGSGTDGSVVGGSGGISTHYAVPAWQTGISGYSNAKHAIPDIAGFAANGFWGHYLIFCDSNPEDGGSSDCSSASTFGGAGGTSFVAPYMAGVAGLLVDYTGSRQGLLNPALYALAKAQYTAPATATACYSNGQTSNTGVTTSLPAAACIFNDVTSSNNDVPCQKGATACYTPGASTFGMLSLTGSSSLTVAFPSTPGFDQVTGIGTINVHNLLTMWNTAFTSATGLTATPTSITSSQSTTLKATVTGGTPTGYVDTPPAVTGTASFKAGSTSLGNCTLSSGTCSLVVPGSELAAGANSVTATFTGSGTYPSSTSSIVTVTVTSSGPAVSLSTTSLSFGSEDVGLTTTLPVTLTNTGTANLTVSAIGNSGTNPTDFSHTSNCGGRSIAPNGTCTIQVSFTPAATGSFSATLKITDNAATSPQSVTLSGTGTPAPAVSLSATSLSFPATGVGTSSTLPVTVTNTGQGSLTITAIGNTGTNPTDFSHTSNCGGRSIATNGTCTIQVKFTPSATGSFSATLNITDNAANSPQLVTLSGTGINPPVVSLSATSLSFPATTVGSTSTMPVTVTNTGLGNLTITAIGNTGTNPTDFSHTSNCGGRSIAPNGTCTIQVMFTPATTGAFSATLQITDNAANSPQSVTLSGTGH